MFGDYSKIMQQMQDLQSNMQEIQSKLQSLKVTGVAGAGLVKLTLNGNNEMHDLTIDQSLLKPDEKEILEDLIAAAHKDAQAKLKTAIAEQMKDVSGLALPGGMPFMT